MAPDVRESQALLAALFPDQATGPKPSTVRPTRSATQTFGSLDGNTAAMRRLAQQVARRDRPQFLHRVALSDGSDALPPQLLDHLPDCTLVLDIIHVTEYWWAAAKARWGETAPEREPGIPQALTWRLDDPLDALLHDLEVPAHDLPPSRQAVLTPVGASLRRHRPFLDYQR